MLELQNKVDKFNKLAHGNTKTPVHARLLDCISELGELSKEYLKSTDYGDKDFNLHDDFELELGDTIYSLLSLANELDIDVEEAVDKVLDKYKLRLSKTNSIGSGK